MRSLLTNARFRRIGDIDVRAPLLALVLTAACGVVVHGDESVVAIRAGGGFQAKLDYCKTCHGLSEQGYRGYFPMPRLAGQQPQYIENQLRAFIERRRTNPIMANVAHALNPSMIAALASYFHKLDSRPNPTSPPAGPVMGPTPRARTKFRGLRVSFMSTPSASSRAGRNSAARERRSTLRRSWRRPRTI